MVLHVSSLRRINSVTFGGVVLQDYSGGDANTPGRCCFPMVFGHSFFLGGALWAALSVLLWLPQYFGELSLPTAFAPLDWHIHEMLYGYVAAIVTGFLLTAIPNWTRRFPVNGLPLAA